MSSSTVNSLAPAAASENSGPVGVTARHGAVALALVGGSIIAAAWGLAALAPLGFSIVTVFLFAGPHNWFEARYMLSRMPAKWGPLRTYFLTGILGAILLTCGYALLPGWAVGREWSAEAWLTALATWNTLLVLWVVSLAQLRSRQNPRRDWLWLWPVGLALIGVSWLWPLTWNLALVYLHPLMALWFLDRELARQRPEWLRTYRGLLALVACGVVLLVVTLAQRANLAADNPLAFRITHHAGGGLFTSVSTHLLVATHTFLEMVHYGVWIIAIPLVSLREAPWKLGTVPLVRRSPGWRIAITSVIVTGAALVFGLWLGFAVDYNTTRDVYFTIAMLHVLAEAPFLLRLL